MHRCGLVGRHGEFIAQCCPECLLVAVLDGQGIHERRPGIVAVGSQERHESGDLGFQAFGRPSRFLEFPSRFGLVAAGRRGPGLGIGGIELSLPHLGRSCFDSVCQPLRRAVDFSARHDLFPAIENIGDLAFEPCQPAALLADDAVESVTACQQLGKLDVQAVDQFLGLSEAIGGALQFAVRLAPEFGLVCAAGEQ